MSCATFYLQSTQLNPRIVANKIIKMVFFKKRFKLNTIKSMRKIIVIIGLILQIPCMIQSSLYDAYWNTGTIPSPSNTFNTWIEKSIAELMLKLDQETLLDNNYCQSNNNSFASYGKITSGNIYEVFLSIIKKNKYLKSCPPQLLLSYKNSTNIAQTKNRCIILNSKFNQAPDVEKLFTLLHEITHYVYKDDIHLQNIYKHNKNYLSDLAENKEIKFLLEENTSEIQNEIQRFMEWRSDTQALKQIECSCCVKELYVIQQLAEEAGMQKYIKPLSLMYQNKVVIPHGVYYPTGYLLSWQYESRIQELSNSHTICLHHYFNHEVIDLSKNDTSTLLNRLIIIDKDLD